MFPDPQLGRQPHSDQPVGPGPMMGYGDNGRYSYDQDYSGSSEESEEVSEEVAPVEDIGQYPAPDVSIAFQDDKHQFLGPQPNDLGQGPAMQPPFGKQFFNDAPIYEGSHEDSKPEVVINEKQPPVSDPKPVEDTANGRGVFSKKKDNGVFAGTRPDNEMYDGEEEDTDFYTEGFPGQKWNDYSGPQPGFFNGFFGPNTGAYGGIHRGPYTGRDKRWGRAHPCRRYPCPQRSGYPNRFKQPQFHGPSPNFWIPPPPPPLSPYQRPPVHPMYPGNMMPPNMMPPNMMPPNMMPMEMPPHMMPPNMMPPNMMPMEMPPHMMPMEMPPHMMPPNMMPMEMPPNMMPPNMMPMEMPEERRRRRMRHHHGMRPYYHPMHQYYGQLSPYCFPSSFVQTGDWPQGYNMHPYGIPPPMPNPYVRRHKHPYHRRMQRGWGNF